MTRRRIAAAALGCASALALGLSAPTASAEPAWVRGEVKVNYRSAAFPTATALGLLKTGDAVEVVERKGGWARIQLPNGAGGWLPETMLDAQAPPLERLAQLEGEVGGLRDQLASAQKELDTLRARNVELENQRAEREQVMQQLTDENSDLRAGERWPYLVTGASILGAGMLVGALVARSSARRSGPRIRF